MRTELGREFIRVLWEYTLVDQIAFTDDARRDTFTQGQQSVGQWLKQHAKNADHGLYIKTLIEGDLEQRQEGDDHG